MPTEPSSAISSATRRSALSFVAYASRRALAPTSRNHLKSRTVWLCNSFLPPAFACSMRVNFAFSSEPKQDAGSALNSRQNTLMQVLRFSATHGSHALRSTEVGSTTVVTAFHHSTSVTSGESLKAWMYVMDAVHNGCTFGYTVVDAA